jgi:hypothetical protein
MYVSIAVCVAMLQTRPQLMYVSIAVCVAMLQTRPQLMYVRIAVCVAMLQTRPQLMRRQRMKDDACSVSQRDDRSVALKPTKTIGRDGNQRAASVFVFA